MAQKVTLKAKIKYACLRFWHRMKIAIRNPDIAFGFFMGSSVTSILWVVMQVTMERL